MRERTKLLLILAIFAICWWLPVDALPVPAALRSGLALVRWYAHEHVLFCLVPAFFIAGAISIFAKQGAILRYLGPGASRWIAYPVSAVAGSILAVCSCTVLPLFAGIYGSGAGLGPATTFLYSGPAINVLAIILTARVLGLELGVARAVGAILFAVLIGLGMHLLFRRAERERQSVAPAVFVEGEGQRRPWQDGLFFAAMIGILIFANWGRPTGDGGAWAAVYAARWLVVGLFAALLTVAVTRWFARSELRLWVQSSWTFAKQILPLLLAGVFAAGILLGTPAEGSGGIVPRSWVEGLVGGNSPAANLYAALAGALMYFATLTEVPILEGLLRAGMARGPALALLLAGPAVSLPNMLVIRSVLGTRRTLAFVALVVVLSTCAGIIYGMLPETWGPGT